MTPVYKAFLAAFILTFSEYATAIDPAAGNWTAAEVLQLPPLCRAAKNYFSEEAKKALGNTTSTQAPGSWNDGKANHFCGGIVQVMRGEKAFNPPEKSQWLSAAISNFEGYTDIGKFKSSPAQYPPAARNYFALILYYEGRANRGLGKFGPMISNYQGAIKANPKLEIAYRDLANFHLKQGDKSAANAIIEQGLTNLPNSKSLLKLKASL
ncbi:lipopolysaccharide assembly protein LapB [Methylococcus sp. EFPC2]|uniref:tetratricopeptide repeat protein n=1 Tax=Methylococcus sp. EFPC2 TaxID=2812648 RepID=UPI0019674A39|nr:hypothetical protein [Methylococcus sp. EFPC2]QSA95588.1 hypothetical protein JWZ97_10005 [Methylococcus sp. EFPC2]